MTLGSRPPSGRRPTCRETGSCPFTWGQTAAKAVEHSVVPDAVAKMALHTLTLNPAASSPDHLLERHFTRQHGPGASYGNPGRAVAGAGA